MLACGIQFESVSVRLFNTALFDTSRTATQAHSKTLPLSNERNLTLLTANCLHLQTARLNLDSILNTIQQQTGFSDSNDSPGIKRLLHSVFSKDFGCYFLKITFSFFNPTIFNQLYISFLIN